MVADTKLISGVTFVIANIYKINCSIFITFFFFTIFTISILFYDILNIRSVGI